MEVKNQSIVSIINRNKIDTFKDTLRMSEPKILWIIIQLINK